MTELGTPIQGVTLYSFTRAFHGREYDLEGLIVARPSEGFGPGLEIIGFSSFRGFPSSTTAVAWFRDLVDEVGLVPTSLAVNADIGIHRDRLMNRTSSSSTCAARSRPRHVWASGSRGCRSP